MTAPGADSTNGIACAVVLPDRGAMNADHGVFPRRVHRRARGGRPGASAARAPARPAPGPSPGGRCRPGTGAARPRPGRPAAGSAPASAGCGPAPRPGPPAPAAAGAISRAATAASDGRSTGQDDRGDGRPRRWGCAATPAWLRPCRTSPANFIPNGSAVPPVIRGGEPRPRPRSARSSATSDQQAISTAQPAAVPPGAADGRGPSARLTAGPRPSAERGSPGRCRRARARGRPG